MKFHFLVFQVSRHPILHQKLAEENFHRQPTVAMSQAHSLPFREGKVSVRMNFRNLLIGESFWFELASIIAPVAFISLRVKWHEQYERARRHRVVGYKDI